MTSIDDAMQEFIAKTYRSRATKTAQSYELAVKRFAKVLIDPTDDPDDLTAQQIEERERDLKSLASNLERAKDLAVRGSISADDLDKQRAKILGEQVIIEDELKALRVNRVEDEWSWMGPEIEQSQFENAESADYFQYTEWADIIEAIDVQVDIFPDPEWIGWEPRITVLKPEGEREDVPQPGGQL